MIYSHHFENIPSTQIYLKEHLNTLQDEFLHILISTDRQTRGIGRRNNRWWHGENALAFSFTLPFDGQRAMISLEMAVHLVDFLKNTGGYRIRLKWPNDLLNKKKEKCGGIIVHLQEKNLIVGIGINWGKRRFLGAYRYPPGVVDESCLLKKEDYRKIPLNFYKYVLSHRLSEEEIREKWMADCDHLNEKVRISEDNGNKEGIFMGLGNLGEAILSQEGKKISFFTGSLSLC